MGGSDDDEYRPDVDEEQNFDGDFNDDEGFMWNPDLNSGLFTRFLFEFFLFILLIVFNIVSIYNNIRAELIVYVIFIF